MSDTSNDKLMGFIPKARYVYFTYMFILISAAFNALYSLIAIVGLTLSSAVPAVILTGLLACILAGMGMTAYKAHFTAVDHAHFKYIAILFVAFFVLNIIFGGMYTISYTIGYLTTALIGAIEAVLVWTGFCAWQEGRTLTKDNLKSEIQLALKKR